MPRLHPGQADIIFDQSRFKVVVAGRRWGKTLTGVLTALECGLNGGVAWWIAPIYSIAEIGWISLTKLAQQIPGMTIKNGDRAIITPTGGIIKAKSAQNPDSLRGFALDLAVLDEAAFMTQQTWEYVVRPTLSDRQGKALFITTPNGRNWMYRLWLSAHEWNNWRPWKQPTSSNPFIRPAEISDARMTLPAKVFNQEYEAEFMDNAGTFFRDVERYASAIEQKACIRPHQYVMGVDWGQSNDYTVFAMCDIGKKEIVALERWNQIDYKFQLDKLLAFANRFKPKLIVVESNSLGKPQIDHMSRLKYSDGSTLKIHAFNTSASSKREIIEGLALGLESEDLKIIPHPDLLREMQSFEIHVGAGTPKYSAPAGLHDDTVIATALAWYGRSIIGGWGAKIA
jgi:phage FluMu gp28-like protein